MRREKKVHMIFAVTSCWVLLLWPGGCAITPESDESECHPKIEYQITPEAEVTQLKCEIGTHKSNPSLIFTAGVKNISSEPLRFRLNIFLMDMDMAAGHLIPGKGKPPVLKPGKEKRIKIPFVKTTDFPQRVLVVVKTVGY
jgi:hypothetical protein